MKSLLIFILLLSPACFLNAAAKLAEALSAAELKRGCEVAILMDEGKAVTAAQREDYMKAMSYIDGFMEALTMAQSKNKNIRFISIPENARLRMTYVRNVLTLLKEAPSFESGTASVVMWTMADVIYSP